jgi:hypothetical protein
VSECDIEASIIRRPWPTRGCCTMEGKNVQCKVRKERINYIAENVGDSITYVYEFLRKTRKEVWDLYTCVCICVHRVFWVSKFLLCCSYIL